MNNGKAKRKQLRVPWPFHSLITINFRQLSKMIAQGREHQTVINRVPVLGDNSSHEAAELSARPIAHTQRKDNACKSCDVFCLQSAFANLRPTITRDAAKAVERTLVVFARAVDISED